MLSFLYMFNKLISINPSENMFGGTGACRNAGIACKLFLLKIRIIYMSKIINLFSFCDDLSFFTETWGDIGIAGIFKSYCIFYD